MQAHRVPRAHRARIGMAIILLGMVLGIGALMPAPVQAQENDNKVEICHATSATNNPYVFESVNASSVDGQGQNDHTLHTGDLFDFSDPTSNVEWGDIIPNVLNWDAAGQEIFENHCNDPAEPCDDDQSTETTSDDCQPPCDADENTETLADDCTCEELDNCPQPRCADLGNCPVDPCPAPNESIGDKCYPPCPPPTTRVGDACVPPAEPEPEAEAEACPAPGTLVNGVCTQPQAQTQTQPPVEVQGVVLTQTPAAPELPRTGKDTAALVALGLLLSVSGALLIAAERLVGDGP